MVVSQMGRSISVAALQQDGTHGKQGPLRLTPREAQRSVNDVVSDSDHGHENQENKERA